MHTVRSTSVHTTCIVANRCFLLKPINSTLKSATLHNAIIVVKIVTIETPDILRVANISIAAIISEAQLPTRHRGFF